VKIDSRARFLLQFQQPPGEKKALCNLPLPVSLACGRRVERETVRASLHKAIFKLRSLPQRKEQVQTAKGQQDADEHPNHKHATRIQLFVALRLLFSHMSVGAADGRREPNLRCGNGGKTVAGTGKSISTMRVIFTRPTCPLSMALTPHRSRVDPDRG
jgi:hypothetical protein